MGVLGSFDQGDDGGDAVAHEGGDGAGCLDVADVDVGRDGRDGAGAGALAAGAVGGGCLGGPGSRWPVPVGVGGRRDEVGGEHVKVHGEEASCLRIGRMRVGMENIGRQSLGGGLDISLFWGSHEGSDIHQDREGALALVLTCIMRCKAKALSGDFQEFLDECIGTDAKIGPSILARRIIAARHINLGPPGASLNSHSRSPELHMPRPSGSGDVSHLSTPTGISTTALLVYMCPAPL